MFCLLFILFRLDELAYLGCFFWKKFINDGYVVIIIFKISLLMLIFQQIFKFLNFGLLTINQFVMVVVAVFMHLEMSLQVFVVAHRQLYLFVFYRVEATSQRFFHFRFVLQLFQQILNFLLLRVGFCLFDSTILLSPTENKQKFSYSYSKIIGYIILTNSDFDKQ